MHLTATNAVVFDKNQSALVVSQSGAIAGAPPTIQGVFTPQLTEVGLENATLTFGLPGEKNLSVTVDWGDKSPLETKTGLGQSSAQPFSHTFVNNPNNALAAIPITFTVTSDPNIIVTANNVVLNSTSITS